MDSPRLVIAGLSGDSGKTIASLSILTALRRKGYSVSVFKKGPDYIDPAWLSLVNQSVCRSLDTYLVDEEIVARNFALHGEASDISLIEGNRGLFDSKDGSGSHSTAELAKLLEAPVVLVVCAAKVTRTVAAIIKGCVDFDPALNIAGVILNRIGGSRHLRVLRDAIVKHTGLPVLGAIPKLGEDATLIPGRHLGLVTPAEYEHKAELETTLREIADNFLEIDAIVEIAESAPPLPRVRIDSASAGSERVKIGYFRDSVFTFYYPENLEALTAGGAQLVPVSSLDDTDLPDVDALYIGGGFPETHAERLAQNRSMMKSVEKQALEGLPIYAECGGLMYLSRSLRCRGVVYPMAGVFGIDLSMHRKPVGHGYTSIRIDEPNPFYAVGTSLRGHEFHYSAPLEGSLRTKSCMQVETGVGLGGVRDGLLRSNTLATYTHIHADGATNWASAMVSRASEHAERRQRRINENNNTRGWLESEAI